MTQLVRDTSEKDALDGAARNTPIATLNTTTARGTDEVASLLLDNGPHALFASIASKTAAALQHSQLPQVDIRFRNLSIAVELPVAQDSQHTHSNVFKLPTLVNVLTQGLLGMVTKKRVAKQYILKNVSGAFQPGTTTLILGQPSSGKSSLMKILSGRFPKEKNISVEGEITYNDMSVDALGGRLAQLVGYVTQRDMHYPSLTVQETLRFAHACCSSGLADQLANALNKGLSAQANHDAQETIQTVLTHLPELVLELLGLQNCKDTVVGDAMLRGISGGEKKRVTTGEMLFGIKLAVLMDDISTGLDSAATFDIIDTMRGIAKAFGTTIVISLLQPSPEVFALFDDVLILNEGEIIYHGPQAAVESYFENLGFVRPPERDVADFLLDIGTDQQSKYRVGKTFVHAAFGGVNPTSAVDFGKIFKESSIHKAMLEKMDEPHSPEYLRTAKSYTGTVSEFHQGFWASTMTVLAREFTLLSRNKAFLASRVFMVIVMGLLNGSIFYQFDPKDVQVVIGVVFGSAMFLSLGQAAQIPTIMATRDVFYKQRRSNFYRTSSFVVASASTRIPVAIFESLVFGSLLYWLCGFSPNVWTFVVFEIMLFLTSFALGGWFCFLATVAPNSNVAMPLAMVSILLLVTFAGFVIPKDRVPDYLVWLYWLTPLSWVVRSIMINQYQSPEFSGCTYESVDYCEMFHVKSSGEYYLGLYDVQTDKAWIYYGMIFMFAMCFFYEFLSFLALEYHRFENPENSTIIRRSTSAQEEVEPLATDAYQLVGTPKAPANQTTTLSQLVDGREVSLNVKPSHEKHFVPVTLAFQDLWYNVPLKAKSKDDPTNIDLLKGISGYAKPGTMTALMGASGAGKTTLMDVIAARKTGGKISGKILMNGYEATDTAIRRGTGYCEQMDVHSEASTFREALTFSAFLRQSSDVPDSFKFDSVEECLDLLDLHPIADKLVRGSSMEQLKRLTIGVELAAQPSVLFLDEPTSGLDAQSAKSIMEGVRKVADSGRTVMCTIHQPSTEVFEVFDSLLLLKKGGETVYFGELGENNCTLVEYFEGIPGVSPLPPSYNPATWILECIGAGVSSSHGSSTNFVDVFNQSELKRVLDRTLDQDGVTRPSANVPELTFAQKRAATGATQMRFLMSRTFATYWRTASYNLTRIAIAFTLAIFFGIVFADANYTTYQGINAGVGMVFLSTVFSGIVSFFSVLPVAISDRGAFYRERSSQTYNALWYFLGITVAEIPYVFFCSLIFTALFYPLVGFKGFTTGVLYWINKALLILMQTYMGQLLAFALPTAELAMIGGVLLNSVFFLFMGFNPPTIALPSAYKWLYYVVPKRYSFSILAALVFADCPDGSVDSDLIGCQPIVGAPLTLQVANVKQYIETIFDAKHDDIWFNFAIVLFAIVLIRVLGLLALRFINHQKR
ncbi:Atp-binding protein, partial [Globisporangium splendens]